MNLRGFSTLMALMPTLALARADSAESPAKPVPFDWADWTWLNGTARTKDSPIDTKYFTGEFRLDAAYIYDFNNPKDHTLAGSSESWRTQELRVQQLGIGGDFHSDNVRGRLVTQFGVYSTMTPRNDASTARGQWNLADAYGYLSEAYGGYHFDHGNGVNAGIFMSYVELFSYYNFDNWAYQPSYVSSNTPWFFNGVRIQTFPSQKLKLEYWGYDTPGNSARMRLHSENSVELKYFDDSTRSISKAALSVTVDAGCENGGGAINNPGRYLVPLPPINGATAASGTPYFSENPGDPYHAWDAAVTFDFMPSQFCTMRFEFNHRAARVPYFAGPGGVMPPGGNSGATGSQVTGWSPDLRKAENRIYLAMLSKL